MAPGKPFEWVVRKESRQDHVEPLGRDRLVPGEQLHVDGHLQRAVRIRRTDSDTAADPPVDDFAWPLGRLSSQGARIVENCLSEPSSLRLEDALIVSLGRKQSVLGE